jgi:hypothetical protein
MVINNDYMALDESDDKYKIEKLEPGSTEAADIFNKSIEIYSSWSRFWVPRLEVAKKCMKYLRRDIFTPEQRAYYKNVQEKIPVEPQEMKQVIDTLVGQIMNTIRSAAVTMEDGNPPENAARPEVVAKVLKWWQSQLKVDSRSKQALRNGLVTGYPQWILFQKRKSNDGFSEKVEIVHLDLYSTLCSPYFNEVDGSDVDGLIVMTHKTHSELQEMFPERKAAHDRHLAMVSGDPDYEKRLFRMDESVSSDDRKNIIFDRVSSARYDSLTGRSLAIERYHVVRKKRRVYVNEQMKDCVILPPEWEDWRKLAWLNAHPEYALKTDVEYKTMWVTTVSDDGFVWENKEHWFQCEGHLPGVPYIADMVDNVPTGKGEDMLPYILQVAVCETEGLSQVRTGTGSTTFVTEGALRHPARFTTEMSLENGVVMLKKGFNPDQNVKTVQRKPNDTYHVMADRAREQLKAAHGVNDTLMGYSNPRQSNRSKQTDLQTGLNPQSSYVLNYNYFQMNLAQLLCDMMPYFLTDQMIVTVENDYGAKEGEPVDVNVQGFDPVTGQSSVIANDITSSRYKIVPIAGDDSVTTREKELKEFVQLLEAVGNTLFQIDPKILANILQSWPNHYAQEAGRSLSEFSAQNQQNQQAAAQTQMQGEVEKEKIKADLERERINKPRYNFRIQPTDFKEAPTGTQIMLQVLNAMNQKAAQEPAQPQGMEQMPQGEQMPQPEQAAV